MSVPLVSTLISLIFDVLIVRFVRRNVFNETANANLTEIGVRASPAMSGIFTSIELRNVRPKKVKNMTNNDYYSKIILLSNYFF